MKHEPEFRRAGWSLLCAALLMCASSARGAGTTPKPTPEAKAGKPAATVSAPTAVPTAASSTEKAPATAQPTAEKAEKTSAAPTPAPSSSKAAKTPAASGKPASGNPGKTPAAESGKPEAGKAGKTPAAESGTPAAGKPAGKTPGATGKPAAGKPKAGKAAGTPGAQPSVGAQDVVGGLKKPAVDCGRGNEFLTKALELNQKKQFDVAVELAAKVEYDPKCDFSFVQASGLMAGIYVFETKDYEKGIAAAKKGLALDPRQTSLWFTTGYAQYQVDSFEEAAESFRRVCQHAPTVPLPENALRTTRYLLGDAVDRNSMREGQTPDDQAIRMSEAITVWQEYQDFCEETTCEEAYLTHASARITQLKQDLQILRFKSNR